MHLYDEYYAEVGELTMGLWKGGDDGPAFQRLAEMGCLVKGQTRAQQNLAWEVRALQEKQEPEKIKAIERAKEEIISDVLEGKVPLECHSFSELHDYVDANEYGGACEEGAHEPTDCVFWNSVQGAIDKWIKSLEFRKAVTAAMSDYEAMHGGPNNA